MQKPDLLEDNHILLLYVNNRGVVIAEVYVLDKSSARDVEKIRFVKAV